MLKHYLSPFGLRRMLFAFTVLLFLSSFVETFAQRPDSFEKGKLRIKVTEQLAQQLERASLKANANKIVLTGIQSIDNVSQQYKVSAITRVFRPAGKFEEKHRRYGLHLWYDVQMDKNLSVLAAMGAFKQITYVEKTEPVFKKAIIGSENKDYGPRTVAVPTQTFTLPGASNDQFLGSQWHYNNTGQTGGTPGSDIKLFQAWAIETGKPQVIVAVTDGGIQVNHPDIVSNIWTNTNEIPGNNIDDDNNGYVDDINGYGFGDNTGTIAPDPHGTHTSGTIGATTNNGIGVAGIAGGSGTGDGVRLMSCAAFGANNSGGFAETYVYGADNGAVISQNSWGYTSPDVFEQAVLDGIDYFIAEAGRDSNGNQVGPMNGGIVIFAAGNDDTNAHHYPGFYAPTVAVSGVNHMDKKAWYSNYGDWVDIAAPGGETNTVSQQGVLSTLSNSQYGFFQGTSMATPHVSGVAALIVSSFGGPGLTPDMVRSRLIQTVDNIDGVNPNFVGLLGAGRLNAFKALQQNDHTAPDSITNLAAVASDITSIALQWTSPADQGNGSASSYDIRYATFPITIWNFDSATVAPNSPTPSIAGVTDSYTANGLTPGTTYYFAIKSHDFFGNVSAISNVVQRSTEFPPIISVNPTWVTDTLVTAQLGVHNVTVSNVGNGPLIYNAFSNETFIHPMSSGDTIAQGTSKVLSIMLDANNLVAGDFPGKVYITSNDPVHDTITVNVSLRVNNNGAPIVTISTDSMLNLGGVFVGGTLKGVISVHNAGSETLKIWKTSLTGSAFSASPDTLYVPSFADSSIYVSFTASEVGVATGTLSLLTNDPVHPSYSIALIAEGLETPDIVVEPDSLTESLFAGATSVKQLTIKNTGGSDLFYSVKVKATSLSPSAATTVVIPPNAQSQCPANNKLAHSKIATTGTLRIKSVAQSSVGSKVLIVTPDGNVEDLLSILNSYGDIHATKYPVDSLPFISVSRLAPYDVVMTTNNGQWQATGNVPPEVVGNVLADYIDQGGKVVVNQFAYSYDAWKMTGRFIEQSYGPFYSSTTDADITVSLDSIASTHPIMQGVSSIDYGGFVQNVGLVPGATMLAKWSNGDLFAAANDNVVALNILPSLGSGGALPWAGDLPTFYHNAIQWLSGPSFVKVSPSKGSIPAGAELSLNVTFNAGSLAQGFYRALIDLNTNVPGKELVVVPASLTVLGPEFEISPDSISVSMEKNTVESHTIILTNNGSSAQQYTVHVKAKNGSAPDVVRIVQDARLAQTRTATDRISSRNSAFNGRLVNEGAQVITVPSGKHNARVALTSSSISYATDFESFALGDIDGQQSWEGQFGNWTVDTSDPVSGTQNLHSVSDGLGQTLCFSPGVSIGTESISTTTMKVNVVGGGVTWQVIPQSPTAGFINTRVEFSPDGTSRVLVRNSSGGGTYLPINAPVPSGYFDLTIAVNRDSATFDVLFNDDIVFQGQGFAGDIEQVVFLSLMEEAGPVLEVDDFQIIDGVRETAPGYLTVTPLTGFIGGGESIALTATFNTLGLEFGYYHADVVVDVASSNLTVPTTLRVIGDPTISVDPTVLQAVVGYHEDTIKNFILTNTGGNDIYYSLSVIGASTDMAKLPVGPINKFKARQSSLEVQEKIAKDISNSKPNQTKQLPIDLLAGASLLEEQFDSLSFPPTGWTVVDNAGSGIAWSLASEWGEGNYSGLGDAATVSSDAFGQGEFDTELISPSIAIAGYKDITIQYSVNYQNYARLDFLDLDIKVDGGAWTNVLSWNEDHGSFRGTPGEFVSINLDAFLTGASTFKLRWHYYDPNNGDFDWYAQIDNVVVLGDTKAWLTVNPTSGAIPVGGAANIEAHYYSQDLDPGFYVAGILVNSNAVSTPLVGVVASLTVLNPAVIEVTPTSVSETLFKGQTLSRTVTVSNHGESDLKFTIDGIAIAGSSGKAMSRREATARRTTNTVQNISTTDALAISRTAKASTTSLYATGFEEFATGDIDGQNDWSAQFGNWTIENANAYSGTQHFRGQADGLGLSLAFSPTVAIGNEPISSATMRVNLEHALTTTWQVIPQSTTSHFVNTRVQFSPNGTVQVLVPDSLGGAVFANVNAQVPAGYFELKIEVERATAVFSLYFNNVKVFEGQGFAGDIEEVVILSLMETNGPIFDLDNLAILDGRPQAPWLVVSPTSGIVPANSSESVTLAFDARELGAGLYFDTLRIHSNDPVTPSVNVSATLTVIENQPPHISYVRDTTIIEGQSLTLTFSATDVDDSVVNVWLASSQSFITLQSKEATSATYSFKPLIGNAGTYPLVVLADDGRGGLDSVTFNLTVIPYGIKNFSLYNTRTKTVVQDFIDSVSVNTAQSDFAYLIIRANTNPGKVGSVSFKMDGAKTNTESVAPYDMKKSALLNLTPGGHWLSADAYTKANGKGTQGHGLTVKINIISESVITYYDVVNTSGVVLKHLYNNDVINIQDEAYKKISIVAHVNESKVGSVVFKLNGVVKIENQTPFALNGDSHGYYKPWPFAAGQYWLEGTPYSKGNGGGTMGTTNALTFWVVNVDSLSGIAARSGEGEIMADLKDELTVYPVPTKDEIHLTLPENAVELKILSSTGEVIHKVSGLQGSRHYTVSTDKIGMSPGVYLVQTVNDTGRRFVKKFIKE